MWGIIPAAGRAAASSRSPSPRSCCRWAAACDGDTERPRAVSEYLVERMMRGGADKICFVIAPGKSDILEYYGGGIGAAAIAYVVQPRAGGLCDAIFRAAAADRAGRAGAGRPAGHDLVPGGRALRACRTTCSPSCSSPSRNPELFDAVVTDDDGRVRARSR